MAWKNINKELGGSDAEPLSDTSIKAKQLKLRPKSTNTHSIYIGGSGVTSDNGFELMAPDDETIPRDRVEMDSGYQNGMDLSSIYVIGTSGEGVQGMYEEF